MATCLLEKQNSLPDFNKLPVEIVEKVLFYLDLPSLQRSSNVCKNWNFVYQNLVKHKNIIEVCCKREIPEQTLLDIVEKIYPSFPVKNIGTIDWLYVYKSWFLWFQFDKWNPLSLACLSDICDIKCMKLSGDWIIYGSINPGQIQAYNLNTFEKVVVCIGLPVKDLDIYNNPTYNNDDVDECNKFPNDSVIFFSENAIISFNLNGSRNLKVNHHNLRSSNLRHILQWLLTVKSNYANKMQSLGLSATIDDKWSSKVFVTQNVRFFTSGEAEFIPLETELYSTDYYCEVKLEIQHWFQLSVNVLFGIAFRALHFVFFIVNDKIIVYKPPDRLFTITSAKLHCNILFLGNNKGTVFAYILNSPEDLLNISLTKYNWKHKVCNEEIIAIEPHYGMEYCRSLVVASCHHIYKLF